METVLSEPTAGPLKRTPLHALHKELGARLVPFAGYEMPVQYPTGITAEHNAVRERCASVKPRRLPRAVRAPRSPKGGDWYPE